MKNYNKSDYAVNKYSAGIVYRFADETIEITLEVYLRENPDKTEADFRELKSLSDAIYREQDRSDTNYTRSSKRISIELCDIYDNSDIDPIATAYIEKLDRENAIRAIKQLLDSGELTEIQEMRFRAHFFNGKSIRDIAKQEDVHHTTVLDSISQSIKKFTKYFCK
ncbi:MAG: RNA polymerase subunit sigma-24 [Clostridiales bacterium]|nr:RNA polymerase subunit sigma-24 [Clostridiales bacterium]